MGCTSTASSKTNPRRPGLNLADAAGFLFDVDGTLVLSDDPNTGAGGGRMLGGAAAVLSELRARGLPFAYFTNGTGLSPGGVARRLRALGLDVDDAAVMTPASVAAEHIRTTYPGEPVLAFGTDGVFEPLRTAGVRMAGLEDAETARVVLIGADPEFTYAKLTAACRAVWAGAPMLVTSMAASFASSGGRLPSTSGAIAAGIRHVTGAEPVVVGKPSLLVVDVAARQLGASPTQLVVVGDDLQLEMRMARAAGARGVLVLTGTSSADGVAAAPAEDYPDLVLPVIGDLLHHL